MAKRKLKEQALKLRLQGKSYSQIKDKLGVTKSTLSYWLRDYPLSDERIRELRDHNPKRIERFRNTMQLKRERRFKGTLDEVAKEIGKLSKREVFLAGLFLYWGEGLKHGNTTTSFSNTDPEMVSFFITWLIQNGVPKDKILVRLQLYSDMNPDEEVDYWSKGTGLPKEQFKKPYVKKSKRADISYKTKGRGTCNVFYYNEPFKRKIMASLKYLAEQKHF